VPLAAVLDEASSALLCGMSAEQQLLKFGAVALQQGGSSEQLAISTEGCSSM
jgi:hypothetical protein